MYLISHPPTYIKKHQRLPRRNFERERKKETNKQTTTTTEKKMAEHLNILTKIKTFFLFFTYSESYIRN